MNSFPFITKRYEHDIVTLEQARQWLRMDIAGYTGEDEVIQEAIRSAVDRVEVDCGISLGISEYEWNCDCRPCGILDIGFVTEITSIEWYENAAYTAFEPTDHLFVRTGRRSSRIDWDSTVTTSRSFPHRVKFKAGFAEGEVPPGLLQAIRAMIGEQFKNREDGVAEKATMSDKLMRPYKYQYAG